MRAAMSESVRRVAARMGVSETELADFLGKETVQGLALLEAHMRGDLSLDGLLAETAKLVDDSCPYCGNTGLATAQNRGTGVVFETYCPCEQGQALAQEELGGQGNAPLPGRE